MKGIQYLCVLPLLLIITSHPGVATPTGMSHHFTSSNQVPEGLAKSDWANIRAAYEAGLHAFQQVEGGWQARNPGQQWVTEFDGRGFVAQPTDGRWQWGLELKSYGFAGQERAINGVPAVKTDGQRLTYQWDAGVREWFVNDRRGLEHGFTISERPVESWKKPTEMDTSLSFTLGVRGDLRPAITADAQIVQFLDGHGATVITYSGLKVWDADGKALPSRFAAAENDVRLVVDERGARYPLTIDPIAQQAYLKASNTGAGDTFGISVAVSGDTVVVGAYGEDSSTTGVNSTPNDNAADSGAAYVFIRNGTTWTQQAYLKANNSGAYDYFGVSVGISGDTVIVGAHREASSTTDVNSTPNESATAAGAAYVFIRNGTTWTQQAYLKASNTGPDDQFGVTVSVCGDTVVVGANAEASNATGVGGNQADNSAYRAGAAYVFVRSVTTWTQQAYLKASNTGTNDQFGYSVAISGDTVVVGAFMESSNATGVDGNQADDSAYQAGAAYAFIRNGTTWTQQAYLKASNTGAGDWFGYSMAISGDTVVVGANHEDSSTTGVDSTPNDSASDSGAAYVFIRSGGTWTQQAYLKASNTGAGDHFGEALAVSGNTAVVGADMEDSISTGVNSVPDELASNSGAAYAFTRSGTTWAQQAYLKANNTGAGDRFGLSVAVSGDVVITGAIEEDSSTTGVNSTSNNSASNAGAAYVFTGLSANTSPVVSTPTSANVTTMTATLGGNVTSDGGTAITARGVVFSPTATNSNPQLGGTGVTNVTGTGTTGVFTVDISNLTPGVTYTFAAYATNSVGTGYSTTGSFTALTAPVITTASPLPAGTVGVAYSQNLSATGGATPYQWTVSNNTPPDGLNLSLAGILTGIPNAEGTVTFTVQVSGNDNASSTKVFSLTINPAPVAPQFTSGPPPPNGMVGVAYNHTCTASGNSPISFTVTAGTLPGGLNLGLTSGVISGSPNTAGTFSGTITASNEILPDATQDFSITIAPPQVAPLFTSAAPPATGTVGVAYSHTCTATGTTPISFSVTTGTLPDGLNLVGGVISGTPNTADTFTGTITASNGILPDATQDFSITIAPPQVAPLFTSAAPPATGMVGVAYSHTCTATGTTPISFTVTAGALPDGLDLVGGVISGSPNTAGTFTGTITASNGIMPDATQYFSIVISQDSIPLSIAYVTVGNPGNAADTTGYGAVGYAYKIGKYEVTNAQYAEFLNAVDPSGANPNGIFSANMGSDLRGGISFNSSAANGSKYTIRTYMGDKPVNYVSWYDAARFANWLHNGKGTGSTETGAYSLTGNTGIILKNTTATVYLPSEDEWYKAAYYDPTKGGSGGYWLYPTHSNTVPTMATANASGNISNPGANVANYNNSADWNGQNGNVTTVGSAGATSASFYGAFDIGGNVMEWNDAVISGSLRGMRGGCWIADESDMFSSLRGNGAPTYESGYMGFRVASLTEPLLGVAPQFTSTEPPPTGMVGTAYNHTCTASGTTPISFMVTAGALPGGLDLSSGGVIFGTPNTTGTFTGTITATNGILPNATQDFSIVIDTHEYRTLVATGSNGNVSGGGIYLLNATATLTPNPNPGYLFTGWTGDATGTDNPLSILMNSDKTITATFDPDTNDPDGDGLTNYQELVIYHSNPNVADTDGDGFDDGVEVSSGFNPNDFASRPDGQMVITTAVEVSFLSALGQNYRIESSMDLQTWTPVVDGVGVDGAGNIVSGGHVVGTGDTITLWYTIRNIPKRYFRTVRE